MHQWLLLPLKIIIRDIHKALVWAHKTEKSDSKPRNSNSNEQSSPEPLVVPKLERGWHLWWNKLPCHKLCVRFVPPVSFGGGKCDGKPLQKLFYLSPTITNPQPNTAVCIYSAVCNLHSHMHELHTNSHIPTWIEHIPCFVSWNWAPVALILVLFSLPSCAAHSHLLTPQPQCTLL
jgi:hypothetical protein